MQTRRHASHSVWFLVIFPVKKRDRITWKHSRQSSEYVLIQALSCVRKRRFLREFFHASSDLLHTGRNDRWEREQGWHARKGCEPNSPHHPLPLWVPAICYSLLRRHDISPRYLLCKFGCVCVRVRVDALRCDDEVYVWVGPGLIAQCDSGFVSSVPFRHVSPLASEWCVGQLGTQMTS